MKRCLATILSLLAATVARADAPPLDPPTLLIVVGAPGSPAYAPRFQETATRWQKAGTRARASITIVGQDNDRSRTDRARLEAALRAIDPRVSEGGPVWLVLIGHGTHDGRQARFNLRGPDVSAQELASWCKPLARPLVVVDGASASAPFLTALSGPQRIVVTATRTAGENSAPRFGGYFAEAIADNRADLDHDGAVSVLEAFVHASRKVESSFSEQGLLASEHALLDDNGDGLGTGASFFRGLTPTSEGPRDGARARVTSLIAPPAEAALPPPQRQRRDQLETAVMALREQRAKLREDTYYSRLDRLLRELADLYRQAGLLKAAPEP